MALPITLDYKDSQTPLHQQVYEQMRRLILSGQLSAGQRLPSTRLLADSLGVARATVTDSYDRLSSEGYIHTVPCSGTFVSDRLPEQLLSSSPVQSAPDRAAASADQSSRLSAYARAVLCHDTSFQRNYVDINFGYGPPPVDLLPMEQWRRLLLAHCKRPESKVFGYSVDYAGHVGLREAIAGYLARARAIKCTPDQILIVNGSQQALDLVARVLIDRGDFAAIENPCYPPMRQCLVAQGARILPIPIDEQGLNVNYLPQQPSSKLKLVYVTPSHQYPTGTVLPLSRRIELIGWASRNNVLILEDDYNSEFRYVGRPLPALQGIDTTESVIYTGTFSKVLFPSLRIGYLVLPPNLVQAFTKAKVLSDRQSPLLEQFALADFITEGHLERHIRKMRQIYEKRRNAVVEAFKEYFGDRAALLGENSGMHVLVRFNTGLPDADVAALAATKGIGIINASLCYHENYEPGEFLFGYADIPEEKIREGIRRLREALSEVLEPVKVDPSMSA